MRPGKKSGDKKDKSEKVGDRANQLKDRGTALQQAKKAVCIPRVLNKLSKVSLLLLLQAPELQSNGFAAPRQLE